MPDTLDASLYELPKSAIVTFLAADPLRDPNQQRHTLIGRLSQRIGEMRTQQQGWAAQFDRLYEDALRRNFNAPFLIQWAAALLEKQRAALELLYPFIEGLQDRLAAYRISNDREMEQLCGETIDVLFGWIIPYRDLCGKLIDLASERRTAVNEVLRARPIKGEIDHAALTREIIARYPKILAALAK